MKYLLIVLLLLFIGCSEDNPVSEHICESDTQFNLYTGKLSNHITYEQDDITFWTIEIPGLLDNEYIVSVKIGFPDETSYIWFVPLYFEFPQYGYIMISSQDPVSGLDTLLDGSYSYEIITIKELE